MRKSFFELQMTSALLTPGSVSLRHCGDALPYIFLSCHVMKPYGIICGCSEATGQHQMGG